MTKVFQVNYGVSSTTRKWVLAGQGEQKMCENGDRACSEIMLSIIFRGQFLSNLCLKWFGLKKPMFQKFLHFNV